MLCYQRCPVHSCTLAGIHALHVNLQIAGLHELLSCQVVCQVSCHYMASIMAAASSMHQRDTIQCETAPALIFWPSAIDMTAV